jgi:alkylation response protein AidB-like acyl-CoA dehydrogenase
MQPHADSTLIEATRRIAPVIPEYNQEAERECRLSPPVLAALEEAGLLRMCTPRSLGGLEADPLTRALVIEEISSHDTAAGWTLANPLDWAYLCARLPDAGAEEIYGRGPNALIAAQFGRPMQAIPVQGGYRIAGRAPFVSNCYDANWIATTAVVTAEGQSRAEGEPEAIMAYLPRGSCQVIDTWHVMGMRGTGSNDVAVSDVFVPRARTFPFVPEFTPGSHYQGPLYRFPLVGVLASNLPPLVLAVARRAIEEVSALAQGKVPIAANISLRERASAQAKLARAEAVLRAGRVLLYDTLSDTWQGTLAGNNLSLTQKADVLLAMTHAVSSSVKAVELMYRVAGTSGNYTKNPLERYFRDVEVLRHHAFGAETRYETVGQVYLGLPPDFPALGFRALVSARDRVCRTGAASRARQRVEAAGGRHSRWSRENSRDRGRGKCRESRLGSDCGRTGDTSRSKGGGNSPFARVALGQREGVSWTASTCRGGSFWAKAPPW